MAIRMPRIIQARQIPKRSLSSGGSTPVSMDIPKGYFAIYVGEQEKKRFVVPVSILNETRFQELLHQSEQESKSLDTTIPWAGSWYHVVKTYSPISLLVLEHIDLCRSVSF
ncbi:putative small auxin-up RNA [Helianthus debilis subsp. tardiflorus]